ncbi:MAG: peptide chain release factor 2 [Thermodesulfobacteriota bacterium]
MAVVNSAETRQVIQRLYEKIDQIRGYLDVPVIERKLAEIEARLGSSGLWNNSDEAVAVLKERSILSSKIESIKTIAADVEEADVLLELGEEADDAATIAEADKKASRIAERIGAFFVELTLTGEDDPANAIVSINAGAGGTDSQDWAEMLLRMYTRWVEHKGYGLDVLDIQPGEEAGIKSATFRVVGHNAFGYLKNEIGVHRLVRISPFNASGKRQTSFASVFVTPEVDQNIEIEINDKDIRIDVFRASGAGGQHVNKTSSAVRITHFPSGVVVQCQQEKSQIRNREIAMTVLRSRLYQLEKAKQQARIQEIHDGKEEIAWGNQIRSYFLHPYQKIKDHRVDLEIGNVNSVLDGNIDPFINAVLLGGHA